MEEYIPTGPSEANHRATVKFLEGADCFTIAREVHG